MMKSSGAWDFKRLHFYPLMNWTDTQVFKYLRVRHIQLPPEYRYMRTSWGGFIGTEFDALKEHFPRDYARILEVFPHAEAIRRSYELFRKGKKGKPAAGPDSAPEVQHNDDAPIATDSGGLQPKTD